MKNFDLFERKPKSLKALQGTLRTDRETKEPPQASGLKDIPKPQPWVCTEGKRVFKQTIEELNKTGILSTLDINAFNAACNEFGKYIQYQKLLKKEGLMYKVSRTTAKGEMYETEEIRPEVKLSKESLKAAKELFAVFGLTPLDRGKLHMPTQEKDVQKDEFEEFRNKRLA